MTVRLVAMLLAVSVPGWGQWSGNAKRIQGVPVSPQKPTNGQSLVYNELQKMWVPATISGGGGGGFPLADLGEKGGRYTGIRMEYTPSSSCNPSDPCLVEALNAYYFLPDASYSGTFSALSLGWEAQAQGAFGFASFAVNADGAGEPSSSFSVGAFHSFGSWDLECYGIPSSQQNTCFLDTGSAAVRLSYGESDPTIGFVGRRREFSALTPPSGIFGFEAALSGAPDSVALLSLMLSESDVPGDRVLLRVESFDGKVIEAFADGSVQLREIPESELPACDSGLSGRIAYVTVDDDNTELRVCKKVSGAWSWASL